MFSKTLPHTFLPWNCLWLFLDLHCWTCWPYSTAWLSVFFSLSLYLSLAGTKIFYLRALSFLLSLFQVLLLIRVRTQKWRTPNSQVICGNYKGVLKKLLWQQETSDYVQDFSNLISKLLSQHVERHHLSGLIWPVSSSQSHEVRLYHEMFFPFQLFTVLLIQQCSYTLGILLCASGASWAPVPAAVFT